MLVYYDESVFDILTFWSVFARSTMIYRLENRCYFRFLFLVKCIRILATFSRPSSKKTTLYTDIIHAQYTHPVYQYCTYLFINLFNYIAVETTFGYKRIFFFFLKTKTRVMGRSILLYKMKKKVKRSIMITRVMFIRIRIQLYTAVM